MQDEFAQALLFLNRQPLLRVQALESIKRGSARMVGQHTDGLLIYERRGQLHFLCADTEEAVRTLLPLLPPGTDVLINDLVTMDEYIMAQLGFTGRTLCTNVVYLKREPVPIQTDISLRPLPLSAAGLVSAHYHLHGPEEIKDFINRGLLLGGYLGDTLAGFIGWHEEGDMGMLHVFEAHRRKGYAFAMEALQINLMLARGELPRGQVIAGNEASMALQMKLGFTLADKPVSWLFKEGE